MNLVMLSLYPEILIVYLVEWTGVFVLFQWIVHACVSFWWQYPFLDLSSPYVPLWYATQTQRPIPYIGYEHQKYAAVGLMHTGHSSSTVQVRLLRFWESRTVHHGGERMEVDMLLLDSQAVDNFMVYELMEPEMSGVNAIKIKSLEPMVSLMRANLGPLSMAFVSTKRR
ncbi:hypothetical protein F2Q69_00051318 [Brassica cretica]|uniref:Uncharacterized protein n=1 Tax=Brassica cretica TaxID=69181 RepID=A0A8S9Q1G3_BRACR|nr:hypothetical protein F2Q69_00051318 [Brassica cretica]